MYTTKFCYQEQIAKAKYHCVCCPRYNRNHCSKSLVHHSKSYTMGVPLSASGYKLADIIISMPGGWLSEVDTRLLYQQNYISRILSMAIEKCSVYRENWVKDMQTTSVLSVFTHHQTRSTVVKSPELIWYKVVLDTNGKNGKLFHNTVVNPLQYFCILDFIYPKIDCCYQL